MADFCKQCSMEIFLEDYGDLANLGPASELTEGNGWKALCEGCGSIVVAQDGSCIAKWCRRHGDIWEEEREAFEEWGKAIGLDVYSKDPVNKSYMNSIAIAAWAAWKAKHKRDKGSRIDRPRF